MAYEFLKTRVVDRVGWLEYDRPPVNAIDWTMLREIPAALGAFLNDPGARLGQPEIAIGFLPPVGTTQSLPRLLGRPRALRFLYEGTLVTAEEALAIGLVDFVVPAERLREEVQRYAAALAGKPAEALAAVRRCITLGVDLPYDDALALELEEAVRLAATPDFGEGLRAFLEKRPPKWE